jgi:hypothetical protein
MGNIFNKDFQEFIFFLNKRDVRYILVGGYAVILHGYQRTTGDLDIWIERTAKNYIKLTQAFHDFGLSLFDMTKSQFLHNAKIDVFSFGMSPVAIDIMVKVKGLKFSEAYKESEFKNVEGIHVRYLNLKHLIKAKKSSARLKDLNDIEHITKKN